VRVVVPEAKSVGRIGPFVADLVDFGKGSHGHTLERTKKHVGVWIRVGKNVFSPTGRLWTPFPTITNIASTVLVSPSRVCGPVTHLVRRSFIRQCWRFSNRAVYRTRPGRTPTTRRWR